MLPGETKNEMMAWGFRAIIAIATLIGLPIAGAMLNRVVSKSDEIVKLVSAHDTKLQLIDQGNNDIKDRISGVRETLQDHEIRLRTLERPR